MTGTSRACNATSFRVRVIVSWSIVCVVNIPTRPNSQILPLHLFLVLKTHACFLLELNPLFVVALSSEAKK